VLSIHVEDYSSMMERRIRILQTSFSRHVKVVQGKLSPMQAAQLANQLGARKAVWLAARLVCWLVGWLVGWLVRWTCCSNFAPFGNLSSRISMHLSLSLSLSLSICLRFTLFLLRFSFFQFYSVLSHVPSFLLSFG